MFQQEVYRQIRLDETRVFFTPNADLSATCNALVRENKKLMDHNQHIEAALNMKEPAAKQMVHLQQGLDTAPRVAQARVLEELQTRECLEQLNVASHNLLRKVLWLAGEHHHLKQSLEMLQQHYHQQQRLGQQVGNVTTDLPTDSY
ncbi:hypothetical protein ABBQ32_001933 [Trebouxia sp. C0010 RCD-2024]